MQLVITKLTQVGPFSNSTATINISFTINGNLPSFVQIYAAPAGGGVGSAELVDIVSIKSGVYQYNDNAFSLKPNVYYAIYACPRTGSESQPDDTIDGIEWESYCAMAYLATKSQETPTTPQALDPPVITTLVPHPANTKQPNRIAVMWSSSTSYDKYVLGWVDSGYQTSPQTINYGAILQNPPWELPNQSQDINEKGTSGSWDVPTQPGHLYFFHVNGGISQFWNYKYSKWGPPAAQLATSNHTSLRMFLMDSGISPSAQGMRSLLAPNQSIRNFMQI